MDKPRLDNIKEDNFQEVCKVITEQAPDQAAHYLRAYAKRPNLCAVVLNPFNEVMNIFYPDRNSTDNIIQIHSIMSPAGMRARNTQVEMYKEYIRQVFDDIRVEKIVVTVSKAHPLIIYLTEKFGFILEGTLRKEANGFDDLLYYGLFREDFKYGR